MAGLSENDIGSVVQMTPNKFPKAVRKSATLRKNIGLQFLVRGLSISHEIRMKSGGFQVKSGRFHVKSTQTEEFLLKHLNL